ncbi:MAG: alpha/beta fold hydrolase [Acidobacteria bacterium]|nr:alpha/beta fold hydrolase [Acidobacteriota bacterium]
MSTFLLIHGAWLGGWFWGRVRNELHDAKHNVLTPTLTGLGERAHLANSQVGLETHIQDVINVIEYESLHKIVLVGHGYAGMVISAVANRLPKKFHHLIYLDAIVPQDGESFCDLIGAENAQKLQEAAQRQSDGWSLPMTTPLANWGIEAEVDVSWTRAKLTPHPWKAMLDKVQLHPADVSAVPRTYIRCTKPANPRIEMSAQRARELMWNFQELASGHAAPVTHPRELARLLLGVVGT